MEVARLLWDLKEASVREVHEACSSARSMEFTVVQTYLRRLESKGYVTSRLEGRTKRYRPKVKPRTVIRETVDDLVDRLFGGDKLTLMRHLIEDQSLSESDVEQLRGMLDRMEENS
ncbi:MAG: BlaI/MecI/CopY family transcriptional regulator [Planctomycetaceae bacterium]|nr:BlaI/MecI/CopY family transcriptional regulator [Planctomycetaceae bacterium]